MIWARYIFFIAISFSELHAHSQPPNKRQATLISRAGDDFFKFGEYMYALRYYKAALAEYPEYVEAQFQMAQCFRLLEQYDSAVFHYNSIITNGQDFRYPLARYHLALLQIQNNQRKEALTNLKAFCDLLIENEQHELDKFSEYYQQAIVEMDKIGSN